MQHLTKIQRTKDAPVLILGRRGRLVDLSLDRGERLGRRGVEDELGLDKGRELSDRFGLPKGSSKGLNFMSGRARALKGERSKRKTGEGGTHVF